MAAFHAQGIKVCGYSYVYGNNPAAEAALEDSIKTVLASLTADMRGE